MKSQRTISVLFIVAALYDGLLGVAFLFASGRLFEWYKVTPPNHPGYVQFPALLLLIFALMFLAVAWDPVRNRNLIPYGILLKAAYAGVVLYYWLTIDLPDMWKPFCIGDLTFLVLFAWAWVAIGGRAREPRTPDEWVEG